MGPEVSKYINNPHPTITPPSTAFIAYVSDWNDDGIPSIGHFNKSNTNIIQNGNNCILTAGLNINKFIKLKCTLDEDNQVYVEREIRITNVF